MDVSNDTGHILEYEVIKDHHKMGWLSQARVLRITETAVENCKVDATSSSSNMKFSQLRPTKRLPFTSISRVAVNGTNKFCIRVQDDHIYFYTAENALEIAHEIQKRVTAEKIVSDIVRGSSEDTSMLMRSFCRGDLQLPQYSDDNARKRGMSKIQSQKSVCASAVSPTSTSSGALLADPNSSIVEETKLVNAAKERVYLNTLSLRLDIFRAFREAFFTDTILKAKKLLSAYEQEDVAFVNIGSLRADMDTLKVSFVDEISSSRSMKRFVGLAEEMDEDNDFVSRVADDVLQEEIIKPMGDFLWQSLLLQSDLVGLQHHYDRQASLIAQRSGEDFGVGETMMSIHFGLVTSSMQSITSKITTPTKHMDHLVHVAKSIVLTIEANAKLEFERKRRKTVIVAAPSASDEFPSDSQITSVSPQLSASSSRRQTTLSADDVLPLYIFLLSRAAIPNVVFLREWVLRLGDQTECSERSYYLTVFSSAVEYILNGDPAAVSVAKSPEVVKIPSRPLHPRPLASACSSVSIDLEDDGAEESVDSSSSEIQV